MRAIPSAKLDYFGYRFFEMVGAWFRWRAQKLVHQPVDVGPETVDAVAFKTRIQKLMPYVRKITLCVQEKGELQNI